MHDGGFGGGSRRIGRRLLCARVGLVFSGRYASGPVLSDAARQLRYPCPMCRSIRTLHNFEPPAADEEVRAAALQYVRKISGTARPSRVNRAVFDRAVEEIAAGTRRLVDSLVTNAAPKNRAEEAAKARARAARRRAASL